MKDYVVSHPEALGYSAFSYIDDTIKPLSVDGIAPTRSTIESGLYPLRPPFVCLYLPRCAGEGANLCLLAPADSQ
jgi:phosphate transport system substrate-binding protein